MSIFSELTERLLCHLQSAQDAGQIPSALETSRITVEPPRDPSHGDLATNIAMVLAKPASMPPRNIAAIIADRLAQDGDIESLEIAGPGFINIRLATKVWHDAVGNVLTAGSEYGRSAIGAGEKINLEYVSANPTGPMHVGHARGAVVGDALAGLLAAVGYDVTKEYYINDAGGQIEVLARSALLRMRQAQGEAIGEIPEGLYPGDYLIPVGEALASTYQAEMVAADEDGQIAISKAVAVPMMMAMIRDDLAALGVSHDHFLSELSLHQSGAVDAALSELDARGLVYIGTLAPPKGAEPPPDWEAAPQTLFKSSAFGDDSDRALKKADGSWTYFAPDIACHSDKFRRGYSRMINVWGADHAGYIKRMTAAVRAITDEKAHLDVKVCQMVKLQRDGQPVKMSKRAGDFVTLREVVDEVGKDAVRFMMLTRKNDAPLDFDFTLVKQQSRDNPVFYVQYAHARICSVMRNAEAAGISGLDDAALATADLSALMSDAELSLIKLLATFPRTVEAAAEALEPHRLVFYAQDLAAAFHALWNLGKEDASLRFIVEDDVAVTRARLALLRATALTIANCLDIIGVAALDEM